MTKLSKTREQLIDMYIKALKEDEIPWRNRWINGANINGITKKEYRGVNRLLLSLVSYKEKYKDSRWLTYVQIKQNGYKLKNAKGKGVPLEFWSVYDIKNKKRIDFLEYENIIQKDPSLKENYKAFCNTTFVYNGDLIENLPELPFKNNSVKIKMEKYIYNIIKKLGVKYSEYGNRAFYNPNNDEIVLPPSNLFVDKYSYYATQLHELCHSTGSKDRLNRNFSRDKEDYAREELVAEISSSFLMQNINLNVQAEHYNNHKTYIQSWIKILENKPSELFKAINESKKVCDYIDQLSKNKNKEMER